MCQSNPIAECPVSAQYPPDLVHLWQNGNHCADTAQSGAEFIQKRKRYPNVPQDAGDRRRMCLIIRSVWGLSRGVVGDHCPVAWFSRFFCDKRNAPKYVFVCALWGVGVRIIRFQILRPPLFPPTPIKQLAPGREKRRAWVKRRGYTAKGAPWAVKGPGPNLSNLANKRKVRQVLILPLFRWRRALFTMVKRNFQ